jgi:amino acid transporter
VVTETSERQSQVAAGYDAPAPLPAEPSIALPPDSFGYRIKRRLLGGPLHTEQLEHERLGKPTALAVFASDNLSSSAYATEEILHVLVPAVGIAAFSLVVPITAAMLVVLGLLIISYRETIKEYPSAGGAYLVTRDNFGIVPAQLAGAALLIGYVLTVAVSVAAGSAALASTVEAVAPYRVPLSLAFIALIAYGNLRGVRESGKIFAAPTYFFMVNMGVLLVLGLGRYALGDLPVIGHEIPGSVPFGEEGAGLLMGATAYVLIKAFASGGSAVTGVEAISNGVPAFRKPEWRNARTTLVIMGSGLAVMFLGLSALASKIQAPPQEDGTPTVLAQIGEAVYGSGAFGHSMSSVLNVATMLILVLAANTGFADFPRLASLQAGDSFLPRQLTKRGHRLVFSNGIIALAGSAAILVVITGAAVTRLIPLYAVSVFVGFTMSQAGMTRHHWRKRQRGWVRSLLANGVGALLSGAIVCFVVITRFGDAWVVIPMMPLFVVVLLRLNRQYEREREALEQDVPAAVTAPILNRHVVLVFIDKLDLAAARAVQYARTLTPDELRAVHFIVDPVHAQELRATWTELGLSRVSLDLVDCPDRRLTRAAVELVARDLADGETEVSVLLPDRKYRGFWKNILHDQTANAFERDISQLPHANVTTVPFHFGPHGEPEEGFGPAHDEPERIPAAARRVAPIPEHLAGEPAVHAPSAPAHIGADGTTPIADVRRRQRGTVEGRITTLRVQPARGSDSLECVIEDGTGTMSVVFTGRRQIGGVESGARIRVRGTASIYRNRLAVFNPVYTLLVGG